MFHQELAEIYDLVYRERGKDYLREATLVAELVRRRRPEADSLLDVACGTGEHLVSFGRLFGHVEGLELSAPMRAMAMAKLPRATIHRGDMCDFALGRTFDVVTCLFSSIGYGESMPVAVRQMAGHVVPGGVLVVEPWWFPERFVDGFVAGDVVRGDGRTVARVSHATRIDGVTRMEVHYLVAGAGGVRHFQETHVFPLHSQREYVAAFQDAGCTVEYVESEPFARGLFVGQRR